MSSAGDLFWEQKVVFSDISSVYDHRVDAFNAVAEVY